jgi:hypothetical protein
MPSNHKWNVISATGWGWGTYDTEQEAEEWRDYVARSHADVRVVRL